VWWLVLVVVLLDALLIALLAVPLGIEIDKAAGRPARKLNVYWWFGRLRVPIRSSAPATAGKAPKAVAKKPRPRRDHRAPRVQTIMAFLGSDGLIARVAWTLRRLAQVFVIKKARLHVRFGLDDPADTGMLYGYVSPLIALCAAAGPDRIVVTPEFAQAEWGYRAQFKAEFVPLRIVAVLLRFVFAREVRAALWRAWKAR
jgi:hypothetical protein